MPCFLLEGWNILGKLLAAVIIGHVKHAEAQLAHALVATLEVGTLAYTLDEFARDRRSCLLVEGKGAQELLLCGIVLHKLGGQFHKIPIDIGAAERHETHA